VAATPDPIISSKATLATPRLKKTFLYDIATMPGKTYTLTIQ
jgi:alpha-L-fucosidase 2